MACTDHLRKINEHRLTRLAMDEDIELVKVSVDETGSGEAKDKGHESRVEVRGGVDVVDLPPTSGSASARA